MLKKVYALLIVLSLTFGLFMENGVVVKASENDNLKAEFEIKGESFFRMNIHISGAERLKGDFIIKCNPDVLQYEVAAIMDVYGFSAKELLPGVWQCSFRDYSNLGEFIADVDFKVIGCGDANISIESVNVYDEAENLYEIQPTVTGDVTSKVSHKYEYDEMTNALTVNNSGYEMGQLDIYQDITKKIIFEEGLTDLSCDCFACFTKLEEVVIPSTFTSINEGAFRLAQESNENFHISGQSLSFAEQYATENGLKFQPTNNQLRGDINGNNIYEAEDALGILKIVVELETKYGYTGDANADGYVTAEDALKVLRKVVALE